MATKLPQLKPSSYGQQRTGKLLREGISLIERFLMFPDDKTAEACLKRSVGARVLRLTLRIGQHQLQCEASDDAPLLPQVLFDQDGNGDGGIESGLLGAGDSHLPDHKRHQGYAQYEAAPRPEHHAEISVASGVPHSYGVAVRACKQEAHAERGTDGKTVVAGIKNRGTNEIRAKVVDSTDAATCKGFLYENIEECVKVNADGAKAYTGLENRESVKHSVAEYVREQTYTNGMESFWAVMKRGNHGTYHYMLRRHLDRSVTEFASR